MPFEVDAVYENGMLKPVHFDWKRNQGVKIIVQQETTIAKRTYGIRGGRVILKSFAI